MNIGVCVDCSVTSVAWRVFAFSTSAHVPLVYTDAFVVADSSPSSARVWVCASVCCVSVVFIRRIAGPARHGLLPDRPHIHIVSLQRR